MVDENANAIEAILKNRDALLVKRERLFRLTAAIAARAEKIDRRLSDCVAAGRLFGTRIGLPRWENVLAGSDYFIETSLEEEMERVTGDYWTLPEQSLDRTNTDAWLLGEIICTLDESARRESRPARRSLRQIVLERLEAAGPKGSKAAAIRTYARDNLERDFHFKTVGMTLNRLVKDGLARRKGHVWFRVWQSAEAQKDGAGYDLEPGAFSQ